jgi:hypothetical protein
VRLLHQQLLVARRGGGRSGALGYELGGIAIEAFVAPHID